MLLRILPYIFLFAQVSGKPYRLEVNKDLNDGTELQGRLDLKNLQNGPEVEVKRNLRSTKTPEGRSEEKTSAEVTVHKNLNDQTSLSGNYHNREGAGIEISTSLDDQTSLAGRVHSNRGSEIKISRKFDNGHGSISLSQGEDGVEFMVCSHTEVRLTERAPKDTIFTAQHNRS
ncbi:hypothetical protein Ddc_24444 [Ditylenchus destructor]|nr:hypothetical protein Ddc_24444 [Ditylenchus destructor]